MTGVLTSQMPVNNSDFESVYDDTKSTGSELACRPGEAMLRPPGKARVVIVSPKASAVQQSERG